MNHDPIKQLTLWETEKPRTEAIEIDIILQNPDALSLQQRVKNSDQTIDEYKTAIEEGDILPPIVLFKDKHQRYWVADGIHRLLATKATSRTTIDAIVYEGTDRDALLYAVSANGKHGLRRSHADKRKAVLTLLNDHTWSKLTDREIARLTHTSHPFVGMLRRQIRQPIARPTPATHDTRHPHQPATAPATGNATSQPTAAPTLTTNDASHSHQSTTAPATGNVTSQPIPKPTATSHDARHPHQTIDEEILEILQDGRGRYFTELISAVTGDREPDYTLQREIDEALSKLIATKAIKQISGMYYVTPKPPEPLSQIPGTDELWRQLPPPPLESDATRKINTALFNLNEQLSETIATLLLNSEAPASQELIRNTLSQLDELKELLQQRRQKTLLDTLEQGA